MTFTALRAKTPQRSFSKKYASYRDYKPYLRKDFNERCGYCDSRDIYLGGQKAFHIDHFAPKSQFGALSTTYSNLVYACATCNVAKSNDWPLTAATPSHDGVKGYIDPCTAEYEENILRRSDGRIVATTELGIYMSKQLKLYLLRHAYIWAFDLLREKLLTVKQILASLAEEDPSYNELNEHYSALCREYVEYNELRMAEEA